ncbi:MAG: FAD-binding oxidoreductase [Deltaproteobacteria bacterium]|nr:FAD-binding oxidoreductase [Deltaproteobacteria bacterium]
MTTLAEKLAGIIDPARIVTDLERLDELSWDALSEARIDPRHRPSTGLPICAVLPQSTEEVQQLVRFANSQKIAILPYGGGSGLMGGALSIGACLLLDLRSMNRILDIDTASRSARMQAGVVLESLDHGLSEKGFILGHDPWTVPVATVGGAISTNSVGYRAGLYGSMGDQVLGLEAVLPNGEILRTRAVAKSSVGIDLTALLIGGEGCFGIITEATLRIFPVPEERRLHALRFDSFEIGYGAIQAMFRHRLQPALLDFGDSGAKYDGGAVLYLGFEGNRAVVEGEARLALDICRRHGAGELPEQEAERFWRERHSIARRFMQNRRERRQRGRDGVYRDWIHVALPPAQVLPFRAAAITLIRERGVELQESGLWIEPGLFSMPLALADGAPNAQLKLEEAIEALLRLVHSMGGSMEYTHGVGVKLAPLMADEHGYGMEVMRQIKRTLDPNNILNPGKMGL